MKVGDLVRPVTPSLINWDDEVWYGIVLEPSVNMWGEEVVPTGVRVMWRTGDVEVVYEDEIVTAITQHAK